MTDQDALKAIAAVDRLRLEAARAAMALEGLEAAMVDRGASQGVIGRVLGVPGPVRRWCAVQAAILETGTPEQQAIFRELGTVPVGHDGGENGETGQSPDGCTTGGGHDRGG